MRNFIPFIIAITITVFFINYINTSTQVRQSALKSEAIVANAAEAFLDKVADSGAINAKDYTNLMSQLMSTGGTFSVGITITRLYPIPDPNVPGSYIMDYRPAYGWHTDRGGFPSDYTDPNWQSANGMTVPIGVQYLIKADNIALVIRQVDAMDYQRTMVSRMSTGTNLGEWAYAKAVRDTGNSIVGNQQDPFN